ncbi:NERD domain-containing protein [Frankia sp. CNm7]|uniref:NERD domain-containing protein n=1 Tax=Frankia nepalensis TaxID=1836974 RepID=A0A937RQU9_9ACTN|nr:nuclease-related domain-containing protein [Frankia nepalensis]MBL7496770.1 NERD domain-containing protein [Frankia nepalensis]MBL7516103.1 NERD domain-containing protein [Frankia nepalensis]MBL7521926.1 NERD domain-containing protein [Frankia nepalensis]MBL7630998.1 NERD domain-containing protein [Frankia nepalensis]
MAEYQRRRALYTAERNDRRKGAAVRAGAAALGAAAVVVLLGLAVGLSAATLTRAGIAVAVVVLGVTAARFYRIPPEIEAWRRDAAAEKRAARALDRLARAGYTVLHDRSTADSAGNIDHLIIGASGVWVVETDAHRGPVRQSGAGIWAGKAPLRARLGLVSWTGEQVSQALLAELPEGWQLQAQTVLAFARAEVPGGLALVDGVLLLPADGVAEYVLSAGVVLRPLDVAMLVDVAERVLPAYEVSVPPPSWSALSRLRGLRRRSRSVTG